MALVAFDTNVLAYAAPGKPTATFTREVKGTITNSKNIVDTKWSADALFVPEGMQKTLATMTESEKDSVWTRLLWDELLAHLKQTGSLVQDAQPQYPS